MISSHAHRRSRPVRLLAAVVLLALAALALACLSPARADMGTADSTVPAAGAEAGPLNQVAPVKSWEFERFDSDIKINPDGSLTVRETQVVNFQGSFSFLNRDLVTTKGSFTDGRTYGQVRYRDIKVYDLEGKRYDSWKLENIRGGKRVHMTFSAFNEQKGWIIEYRVTGAIIYANDYDRLYYNTVSFDRAVPVNSSRTTVKMPPGTDMSKVKSTEYPDTGSPPASVEKGVEGDTLWWKVTGIAPQSTFTVDVAFPKGLVAVPLFYRAWFGYLMIALALIVALGVTGWMVFLWWRKGRDVGAPELDVVRYEPPADMRPAEVGVLINETPLTSDITATIVDLAVHHKLVINEEGEDGILKRKKFSFQRWDPNTEDLAPYEQEVLSSLFASGDTVTEDDLKNKFYTHISDIDGKLKDQVLSKGYFDGDPAKVKGHYSVIGLLMLVFMAPVIMLWRWYDLGYFIALAPALGVGGLAVYIVGRFMPRRTAKGSETLSYVKGFKEYMATAEQEEMKFMTPENFQANLPYAMVLGVAAQWAGKFQDIYREPPDWYRGYYGTTFSTVYLADSLTRMQTSVGSTLTSSPSSSGGGGGGFGGGFSGGGFGGGGSSAG